VGEIRQWLTGSQFRRCIETGAVAVVAVDVVPAAAAAAVAAD
jgi:hypothetical protein